VVGTSLADGRLHVDTSARLATDLV
jgi:hypothetical protein